MANWAKAVGAIGDSFKGISSATGAATGNTTTWETKEVGKGNLSKKEEPEQTSEQPTEEEAKEVVSDETLKDSKYCHKHFSDCLSNIDAYLFKYKKSAQDKYNLDDREHVGVMAQDLASNPVTEKSVIVSDDGHLEVNTAELTTENTAVLADLVRRVKALEDKIGE